LQNTKELRTTATQIAAPKPDLDGQAEKDDFDTLFKRNFKKKIISAKIKKKCCQSTIRNFHAITTVRFTTRTYKPQSESQDSTEEQVPFEQPWRSRSPTICTD